MARLADRLGNRRGKRGETATQEETTAAESPARAPRRDRGAAVAAVRLRLAQVVWAVFVLCALALAVGALLIAVDANPDNGLVSFVTETADAVDLGVFSREDGIMKFDGQNAGTKNALVNWGLGAVAYLVVGRVLERVIRP